MNFAACNLWHSQRPRAFGLVCLAMASGLICRQAAAVGVLLDTRSFESPTYTSGTLDPQNGWEHVDIPPPSGPLGAATVQTGGGSPSGPQSVQLSRAVNSYDWWRVRINGGAGVTPQRFALVDWDMRVNQTAGLGLGPFFGIDVYDHADNNPNGRLGGLGIDAHTGQLLYVSGATGFTAPANNPLVDFGTWNHFRIVVDYQPHTYSVYLNGTQWKSAIPFVDGTPGLNKITNASVAAVPVQGDFDSLAAPGTAFIDNFVIRDGLLGDYDLDGDVDLADFTVWKQSLNSSVATPGYFADGNNSGGVDAADFTVWRDNFGASIVSAIGSGGLAGGNAVPEPSSWLLFLLGLLPAHRLLGRWRK